MDADGSRYERVAYLDTDLGQSEFGIGGSVGLYLIDKPLFGKSQLVPCFPAHEPPAGPAFSHPLTPLRSHFIGSLNPRLSSEHYLASVSHLIEQYRYEVQYPTDPIESSRISEVVPLVINTQGWVKGLGADLLLEIERLAEPSHTYTFAESNGTEGEGDLSFHSDDPNEESDLQLRSGFGFVVPLQPIPATPLLSRFTASDMRTLSTISYLHSRASENEAHFWDFSAPLASQVPWQVTTESVFKEIYITGEGADGVLQEDLVLALNNRLVALVERTDGTLEGFYTPGRALPSPTETHCLGMGLIRSISPDGKTIHLLTPLSSSSLSRVSVLIASELELPVCGMLDWRIPAHASAHPSSLFGVPWEEVPFVVEGKDQGVGMARRKFRRNIMRRGQA
jgi:polynucleotide 5'-hydroxyl-kinase GRC3/NOL9